jgi:hypothetical protein
VKQNIQSAEINIAQQKEETVSHEPLPKKETKKVIVTATIKKKEFAKPDVAEIKNNNNEPTINKQPVITHNNIAEQRKEPPSTINNVAQTTQQLSEKQNEAASLQTIPDYKETGYAVYPVAYKELNTNDEDRSLHVGMFDLNKEKVKTFFKKAGRMFTNRSNTNNKENTN